MLGLGSPLRWGFVPAEALVGRGIGDEHGGALGRLARRRGAAEPGGLPDGVVGHRQARRSAHERRDPVAASGLPRERDERRRCRVRHRAAHLGSGADRYLLELRGVPFRSKLRDGTPIVTSGLGGVFRAAS
jgi:rod shape-determining protein MreC